MRAKVAVPVIALAITALAVLVPGSSVATGAGNGDGQNIVVHLPNYTNDLHSAFMAVKLAVAMQKQGADVTLFLDLEGVRMADKRVPLDVMWGMAHAPLSQHYDEFVKGGGKVILCPHCAMAVGIGAADLREGAVIGDETKQDIPNLLLKADKILDY
jgi:predicted peroxiredoxin